MTDVVNNADIVLQNLVKISEEYGVTLTNDLKDPWIKTSEQVALTKNDIDIMLDATEVAIGMFNASVNSTIDQMYARMQQTSSDFTAYLGAPYKNVTASGGPINTFSTSTENALKNAVTTAQNKAKEMTTAITSPWKEGQNAVNTWSKTVESKVNSTVNNAIKKLNELNTKASSTPSYYSGNSNGGNGGSGGNNSQKTTTQTQKYTAADVKMLQSILNEVFSQSIKINGTYDSPTYSAVKEMQKVLKNAGFYSLGLDGKFGPKTRAGLSNYVNSNISQTSLNANKRKPWFNGKAVSFFQARSHYIPGAMFAKGTLGTKKDQWAITDEPQFGDELTLVPTKQGNLSYMRKGTSVVPAAITEELLKLADIGVDGLTMPKFDSGINIVTNAISKPEFNFSFDSMVHVDHCDEGTVKDLEKMVDTKINQFTRQMNYAIRKFK